MDSLEINLSDKTRDTSDKRNRARGVAVFEDVSKSDCDQVEMLLAMGLAFSGSADMIDVSITTKEVNGNCVVEWVCDYP